MLPKMSAYKRDLKYINILIKNDEWLGKYLGQTQQQQCEKKI